MVLLSYCKGSGGETVDSAAPCPINPFLKSCSLSRQSSLSRTKRVYPWQPSAKPELSHWRHEPGRAWDTSVRPADRTLDPPARSLILLSGRPSVRHHPSPQSVLRHHRVLGLPHRYLSRHHAIRRRLRQCGGSTKGYCPRSRLHRHLRLTGHHRASGWHRWHHGLLAHLDTILGHTGPLHALGEDVLRWLWKRVSAHFSPMPKSSSALISLSVSAVLQLAPKSEQMRPHRPGWLLRVPEYRPSTPLPTCRNC